MLSFTHLFLAKPMRSIKLRYSYLKTKTESYVNESLYLRLYYLKMRVNNNTNRKRKVDSWENLLWKVKVLVVHLCLQITRINTTECGGYHFLLFTAHFDYFFVFTRLLFPFFSNSTRLCPEVLKQAALFLKKRAVYKWELIAQFPPSATFILLLKSQVCGLRTPLS